MAAPVSIINRGSGGTGASAEQHKASDPVSVYRQTLQRTITLSNRQQQTHAVRVNNYQAQRQQPVGYAYVPGQNANAAQNGNQSGVSYQYTSSGAATFQTSSSKNNH